MDELPQYVQQFNKADHTSRYLKQGWSPINPIETYMARIKVDNPYEGSYTKDENVNFPIDLWKAAQANGRDVIKSTPQGNTVTLDLAKEIIINENLGNNPAQVTDFFAISLSSTDYIGHQFAINSVKIEDTYIRLDKDLGDFFTFLDEKIGKGEYTVFLSADHGAAHNPQYFLNEKGNAGFLDDRAVGKEMSELLQNEFGEAGLVYAASNYQLFLDHKLIEAKNLDVSKIKTTVISFMKKQPGVAFAIDMDEISSSSAPTKMKELMINGYNYKRSGDIQIILEPQWFSGYRHRTGTTHGAWNPYDSHIPLVFMGWGIKQGKTHAPIYLTDVAPTLAAFLQIQQPNGTIGEPIIQLVDE